MPQDLSDHLQDLREDIRGEIKQRIEQRDKYSNQLTIALGAIFGVALSREERFRVLLAVPVVSLYFMCLIQYSYKIHRILARYLEDAVEPQLANLHGIPRDQEWETWYKRRAAETPGIRSTLFFIMHGVVSAIACLFVLWTDHFNTAIGNHNYLLLDWSVMIAVFVCSAVVARPEFWRLRREWPSPQGDDDA